MIFRLLSVYAPPAVLTPREISESELSDRTIEQAPLADGRSGLSGVWIARFLPKDGSKGPKVDREERVIELALRGQASPPRLGLLPLSSCLSRHRSPISSWVPSDLLDCSSRGVIAWQQERLLLAWRPGQIHTFAARGRALPDLRGRALSCSRSSLLPSCSHVATIARPSVPCRSTGLPAAAETQTCTGLIPLIFWSALDDLGDWNLRQEEEDPAA